MTFDLTCIITGHREGRLAVPSLRSFWTAIEAARMAGFKVEVMMCLDRSDVLTQQLFEAYRKDAATVDFYDEGDQGKVRNGAVSSANGKYCAFLDADDLWSRDWLVEALTFLKGKPDTHIAHPQFNYFFEKQATIFTHVDQESPEFRPDLLRFANYWDALCVCPTAIYREIPFCVRDIAAGYAYEDWQWNCETVAAGYIHKVVPETVLFKRRQKHSQTVKASENRSLTRRHPLLAYDNEIYTKADRSQ
ncbi:glycosyltransferase family A protein [uncultured Litoreibacter sp.]|uniref:glycosyltransferase family A protein n=1 Tax=uncultured Litoreibacter sp. TaxID=1392394 RepID=UPI0026287D27|nr:glycosyltransferase family A protein [uncultured Litoreibacter sp.]